MNVKDAQKTLSASLAKSPRANTYLYVREIVSFIVEAYSQFIQIAIPKYNVLQPDKDRTYNFKINYVRIYISPL